MRQVSLWYDCKLRLQSWILGNFLVSRTLPRVVNYDPKSFIWLVIGDINVFLTIRKSSLKKHKLKVHQNESWPSIPCDLCTRTFRTINHKKVGIFSNTRNMLFWGKLNWRKLFKYRLSFQNQHKQLRRYKKLPCYVDWCIRFLDREVHLIIGQYQSEILKLSSAKCSSRAKLKSTLSLYRSLSIFLGKYALYIGFSLSQLRVPNQSDI